MKVTAFVVLSDIEPIVFHFMKRIVIARSVVVPVVRRLLHGLVFRNRALNLSLAHLHNFRSTATGSRTFCPHCGTSLTCELDDFPNEVDVTTCSLDHPELLPQKTTPEPVASYPGFLSMIVCQSIQKVVMIVEFSSITTRLYSTPQISSDF